MGVGRITHSTHPNIEVGGRYFGFFPMSDFHVVTASPIANGFTDRSEHRARHASAYRNFNLVSSDPAYSPETEGQYLIVRGLFITSFLADDFLGEQGFFGASTALVTSASSRTSIALAHRLKARGDIHVVGLTSARNIEFVRAVGLYDTVIAYEDIETLDGSEPAVMVDMAGNVDVITRVHNHFGNQMKYSCRVGATHWDAGGALGALPGATPTFFFAPSQMKKRSNEWGREVFETAVATALADFIDHSRAWMVIERSSGLEALEAVYRATLEGETSPEKGQIVSLSAGTA